MGFLNLHYMKWFAAIAVVGALAGCVRTAPIDQVHSTVSAGHTQEQVKKAILKKLALNANGLCPKPDKA